MKVASFNLAAAFSIGYCFILEHEIDGEFLLLLVDDLEEFSKIIPKAVSRLKIKKFVRESSRVEESRYTVVDVSL